MIIVPLPGDLEFKTISLWPLLLKPPYSQTACIYVFTSGAALWVGVPSSRQHLWHYKRTYGFLPCLLQPKRFCIWWISPHFREIYSCDLHSTSGSHCLKAGNLMSFLFFFTLQSPALCTEQIFNLGCWVSKLEMDEDRTSPTFCFAVEDYAKTIP